MKIKLIISIFCGCLLVLLSCKKEKTKILDLPVNENEITRIELRADHKTLIPNGISQMQFYPIVYAKRKVKAYTRDENNGPFETKMVETEFIVPNDLLPDDAISVYSEDGKELKDNIYSTTTDQPGTILRFYAQTGNIKSDTLQITIRELPDNSYDSIIVPVIFHIMLPPTTAGPSYSISTHYLEQQLNRVSKIMNGQVTTDPNAGNAKIRFKLAVYDQNGVELMQKGKNTWQISKSEMSAIGTSSDKSEGYGDYILDNKKQLIWDPNKYLNIWITKYSNSLSTYGSRSFKSQAPGIIHSDYDLSSIPGLPSVVQQDTFSLEDVTNYLQAGIMVNFRTFLDPNTQGQNEFTLAKPVALHYGILETFNDRYGDLNDDGDNDYCPDTYSFDYYENRTVFKNNYLYQQPDNDPDRPLEYFTSFNIMDYFSKKNSMSADQVTRMRKVLKECPSRWSYKSDWAFTGK